MNEFFNRIKSESPIFFKKLKAIAISVGGSALAVLALNGATNLYLPDKILTILGYIVAICAAIAGTSQLTRK